MSSSAMPEGMPAPKSILKRKHVKISHVDLLSDIDSDKSSDAPHDDLSPSSPQIESEHFHRLSLISSPHITDLTGQV